MSDGFSLLLFLALAAITTVCATIASGLSSLSHFELKQLAQSENKQAKAIYPLQSMGYSFFICVWFLTALANTAIIILLAQEGGGWFAFVFGSIFILLFNELLPKLYMNKRVIAITSLVSPVLKPVVAFCSPVTKRLARLFRNTSSRPVSSFTTKEELIEALSHPKSASHSDLSSDELRMLRSALHFSDKKIRDVMTPRRMATVVTKDDRVGPIMMDELHKSGYSRFPVIAEPKHFNFVGTLYMHDLVGRVDAKRVRDIMSPFVRYIHEEETLDHALRAFLKTRHHLFVVVNNFEEFVGVLSIEDVLEEIIGKEIVDEFDAHEDLRAVASSLAQKEKAEREKHDSATKTTD